MDGDAHDLELLVASARGELDTLRAQPRLTEPLAGTRGVALREHVLDLVGAVEHRIASRPDPAASATARQAYARSLRQGIQVVRAAHAAIPWLEATREPNANLGGLYLTEQWARTLTSPDVDLVMVPDPEFMYFTTSWPFRAITEHTPGFTPTARRRPIVLNYPLSDSDRLLLHAIFAHEIGHASCDEHGLVATVEKRMLADVAFVAELIAAATRAAAGTSPVDVARAAGQLRGQLRGWIEELLCDLLATAAAGPAFAWAFAGFALPIAYGKPGTVHPPNTLRLQLILDRLARSGWRTYMERVAPTVTTWLDAIASDATQPLLDEHPELFRRHLLAHADALHDVAAGRVGDDALSVDVVPDADEAAALLSELIVPVGLERPLDAGGILLGGWQDGFAQHGDSPSGLVQALADAQLQELVGKAIELSTVAVSWGRT
jgi:hypothetical protein